MKIEVVKEKILGAVSACERISGKHVSLPVLSCIILEAKGGELLVKATNLDVGIEVKVPAKVEEEGKIALSGQVLKSFLINSSGHKGVKLSVEGNNLHVSSEGSKAVIKTEPHDDFPELPRVTSGKKFVIEAKEFVQGAASVSYSASLGSFKPELSSVYIYPNDEGLVFVATDSFRLAEKKIKSKKIREQAKDIEPMLVPFKNIAEISRVFGEVGGEIEIEASKNQVSFFAPAIHITSRVVDGNFPDYKQIIPKEFTTTVTVLKQDFLGAMKLTSSFYDNFHQVVFGASVPKKELSLKTKNNDVGEGMEVIKATVSGQDLTISFNHRYIFDCLQSIEGESLILEFSGQNKPLVISTPNNRTFTYLVMPMNR